MSVVEQFHLQGQHDQQSHAGDRATGPSSTLPSPAAGAIVRFDATPFLPREAAGFTSKRPVMWGQHLGKHHVYVESTVDDPAEHRAPGTKALIVMRMEHGQRLAMQDNLDILNGLADAYEANPSSVVPSIYVPREWDQGKTTVAYVIPGLDPDVHDTIASDTIMFQSPLGANVITVNSDPEVWSESAREQFGKIAMPQMAAGYAQYLMAHEYGHVRMALGDDNRREVARIGGAIVNNGGMDMSEYGLSNQAEAHAEAFAEWTMSGGQTTNRSARLYARDLRWPGAPQLSDTIPWDEPLAASAGFTNIDDFMREPLVCIDGPEGPEYVFADEPTETFHLQGQHDQQTHAGGRAARMGPKVLNNDPDRFAPPDSWSSMGDVDDAVTAMLDTLNTERSDGVRFEFAGYHHTPAGEFRAETGEVRVSIFADGNIIGHVEREFIFKDGTYYGDGGHMYASSLRIQPEFQGRGIGTQVQEAFEDFAAASGIPQVQVDATEIGRYAWARAGYDFKPRAAEMDKFEAWASGVGAADLAARFGQAASELRDQRAGARPFMPEIAPTPWETAAAVDRDTFLDSAPNWEGVKQLRLNEEAVAASAGASRQDRLDRVLDAYNEWWPLFPAAAEGAEDPAAEAAWEKLLSQPTTAVRKRRVKITADGEYEIETVTTRVEYGDVMREEFHGNHDQSDHGNWARGSAGWEPLGGRVRSDRRVEYNEAGDRYRVAAADGTMIEAAVYALGYDAERRLRSATWKQRTVDVLNGTVDGYDRAPTEVPPMVMVLSEFPFGMPDNASRAVAMVHSAGEISDTPPSSDSPFAVADVPGNAVIVNGTLSGEHVWDVFQAGAEKAMMPAVKQGLARYTGAHEYGHTRMAAGVDSQATLVTLWDEIRPQTLSFDPEWKATSPYGRSNPAEAHAEAFAEWAIGDQRNPLAAFYAARLGWGDPNEDALAAAAGRSGDRYEWLFDGPDGPAAIVDRETTTYPLDDTTETFHLQGQHDQQTHAGGSGLTVDSRALRPGSAVFTDEYGTLDIRSTGVARIRQAVFEYEGGNDAFEVVFIEDDGAVTGADVYGLYGDQNTVEGEQALVAWLAETGIDDVTWDGERASKHATAKAAVSAGEADARERLVAKVQDVYSGDFDVDGRSYTIGDVNTTSPQGVLPLKTEVSGSIFDADGGEVGTFSRSVYEDGTVFNHALNISVDEQGKGIGTAFLDQTEAGLGATEYRVAAVAVGKYAWAARGYQLDARSGPVQAADARDRWADDARALGLEPAVMERAEAVLRSWSDDLNNVYPADLLAVDPRFKRVFLNGTSWDGVRRVGDPRTANLTVAGLTVFHLQGEHDQQTHAGHGGVAPRRMLRRRVRPREPEVASRRETTVLPEGRLPRQEGYVDENERYHFAPESQKLVADSVPARPVPDGWTADSDGRGGDERGSIRSDQWGVITRSDWDFGSDAMPLPEDTRVFTTKSGQSIRMQDSGMGRISARWVHSEEFWRNPRVGAGWNDKDLAYIDTWKKTRDGKQVREVLGVGVHDSFQRQGIATEMWKFAKERYPNIVHSNARLPDGKAWIESLEKQGLAVEGITVFRFRPDQARVPAGSSGGGRWGGGGRDGRPIPPPPGKARTASRPRPLGVLADVAFSEVRIAYRPRHPDGKADPGEIVWAKIPFEEDASQSKDRPVLIIGRTADGKNLVGVQLTSKPGRSSDDRLPVGSGDWDKNGRESYLKLDRFVQVDDANYRREGAYVKKDAFQTVVDELTERQGAQDVKLAVEGITVFRFDPGQARDGDGRWTSIGGGSIGSGVADRIATGETIRVSPSEVAGIVATFADVTEGTVDLTAVDVDGYPNLFSDVRNNTIARADMPQIPRVHIDGFREQLTQQGVGFVDDTVDASTLSATQNELDGVAVARMIERIQDGSFGSTHRIMVSSDGRILDGHHRWAAAAVMELDGDPAASPIDVVRIDLPIGELLDEARTYNIANGVDARAHGEHRVSFSNASMTHLSSEMHQLGVGCDDASCSPPPFGTGGSSKDPATIKAEVKALSKAQRTRYKVRRGGTHEEAMMRAIHGRSDNSGLHEATAAERSKLGVAPGMRYVMVAESADGNANGLVARGIGPNGQVQSKYSAAHTAAQSNEKYERQSALHDAMPKLDRALARDAMNDPAAAVVQVMRASGLRVDSAGATGRIGTRSGKVTYGASTLEARHVTINQGSVRFKFLGKGSKQVDVTVRDPALVQLMTTWKGDKTHSARLFDTSADDTIDYINSATGGDFKNHDLRTYKANTIAATTIAKMPRRYRSTAALDAARKKVGTAVSKVLGNESSMALKSYINPAMFNEWSVAS